MQLVVYCHHFLFHAVSSVLLIITMQLVVYCHHYHVVIK